MQLRIRSLRVPFAVAVAVAGVSLLLAACGSSGNGGPRFDAIEINIAHVNDHHSQLESFPGTELLLAGEATRVELGGFARQTALFRQVDALPNPLKLHAGDAVTGTLYYTFFKGAADARMMNTICFDAFALGNHEFDDGDAVLRDFLGELGKGGCGTAVLAANVVPAAGTPLAPSGAAPLFAPYTIRTYGDVKVGVVGIDVACKTRNSSRPLASTQFLDEVASAQKSIDELKGQGIRHIVLLTHQGYAADKAMAAQLSDVDVIIGGDSHTLLGDFSAHGLAASGAYPTLVTNRDGDRVCVGQAWEYAKAFGLMNVRFDDRGAVASCSGQASLVIGESFQRRDGSGAWVEVSGQAREALLASLAGVPTVRVMAEDPAAASILAGYAGQVESARAQAIGSSSDALCLVRVPGESTNRSGGVAGCEAANTLARGSDAAQAVAEAFLSASRRADFSLQNAGGVRIPVPAGTVTMNTAFTLLPFTNLLIELNLTGAEVVAALEDAVSSHLDAGGSSGSHPYAAGLRWDLDMSAPRGSRFLNVQAKDRATGAWAPLDPARSYVLVTNDFIAAGRDGYAALGTVHSSGRYVNTYLLYTQSFADWVAAKGTIGRPAAGDNSHQRVVDAAGRQLP